MDLQRNELRVANTGRYTFLAPGQLYRDTDEKECGLTLVQFAFPVPGGWNMRLAGEAVGTGGRCVDYRCDVGRLCFSDKCKVRNIGCHSVRTKCCVVIVKILKKERNLPLYPSDSLLLQKYINLNCKDRL